ncbi:Autophagy-related protein 9, partial [Rhizoctonia solani]
MSAYVDEDEPSASLYVSRAPNSMRSSQSGRPFLSMLNPMGRSYAGYAHPGVVEEEDEEEIDLVQHPGQPSHLTRRDSVDDDEVPTSLMIEISKPKQLSFEVNQPPRPSDLIQPSLPQPAVAPPKPMRGMDNYERALWNWFNVYNLDAFLQEVYAYYEGKGIYCIALSKGLNLLTVGFVIGFSTFLLGCVDYSKIRHTGTTQLSDVVISRSWHRFSGFTWLFFMLFGAFYIYQILQFIFSMQRLFELYQFYTHLLGVPDSDVQTISWPEVVRRIGLIREHNPITSLSSQTDGANPTTAKLDAHDIANRIMRQENYLIALFDRELLDLRVPLPKLLERLFPPNEQKQNLTRALEWNLRACLLGHLFDHRGTVRGVFLKEKNKHGLAAELRRRMIFFGAINFIFAPLIVTYLLMHSFFRYFEEYHKNPSSAGARQYTPYAKWTFREYNELPHIFARRLDNSYPMASEYMDQFPKEKMTIIARFVSFISGSFAAVLILASVIDPDIFLHFEITPGRTVVFYITVFGTILGIARGMVPDAHQVFDPEMILKEVIRYTHYLPKEWEGQLHSKRVHTEFGLLFDTKVTIFLNELISVMVTPFILWYSLPQHAEKIIDFFRESTWHVEGLGYVCNSAVFDLGRHGRPFEHEPEEPEPRKVGKGKLRERETKMEQSLLNFKAANPEWNPSDQTGSLYLSRNADMAHPSSRAGHNLRQARSRSRFRQHLHPTSHTQPRASSPTIIHRDRAGATATENFGAEVQMPEAKLAERAAVYERALQHSVKLRSSTTSAPRRASEPTPEPMNKDPDSQRLDIGSALGESYDDAQPIFGEPQGRAEDPIDEEFVDGGFMGLLGNIYEQRKGVL